DSQRKHRVDFGIHAEIYRPQRFEEISTVVAHYCLQDMTGLEFFEQMKHSDIQKILLVEEEQEDIAREALSKGSIHAYICKQDHNWSTQFCDALQNTQWQYFIKLSELFMKSMGSANAKNHALVDLNFQKFFKA